MKVAEGDTHDRAVIDDEDEVREFLGPQKYTSARSPSARRSPASRRASRGRSVGGEILFIEATRMSGTGKLQLTGQLGDVMKESAQAALSLRARRTPSGSASRRTSSRRATSTSTSPRARMPKDGPTAGVTMFTALVSLLTGIRVRHDVAMTGEITLRGRVLPIGGLKEKVLAAHRAGIKRVIIPERNKTDLIDVPRGGEERDGVLLRQEDRRGPAAGADRDAGEVRQAAATVPPVVVTPPTTSSSNQPPPARRNQQSKRSFVRSSGRRSNSPTAVLCSASVVT